MSYFADRAPRRPPVPVPRDAPRHRELIAVLAVAAVLTHLLLGQLTLVLVAILYVVDRVSRWRPQWLAVPAGIGALWALAIGPSRAVAGLTAGPRQVLTYLGGIGRYPGHLLRPLGAYAGLAHWLPEQFPLALILASAEVFGLSWLQRRLEGGRAWRTGLIVAARRRMTTASLRSGGVVSRDGCRVGLDVDTGHAAEVSWREAEGGVLCAGPAAGTGLAAGAGAGLGSGLEAQADPVRAVPAGNDGLTASGFIMAHAAVRRRKPVIVIDLTGSPWLAGSLAAACLEPGAPFSCFGQDGPGYYEPLRGGDPARAAALVMAMIDWAGVGDQQRRSCAAYLTDALAVQVAAPGDRRVPVLDDLVRLLIPDALRQRAARIPAHHPRREVLADRASVSANLLHADPATVAAPAVQLPGLRASALGRWLQPGPPGTRISLGQTVRERGVALFSLDCRADAHAARMIAGLVTADLMGVCSELHGMSVPGDSLAWINGCEVLGQQMLAELVAQGRGAGMGVVLGTASAAAVDHLAAQVDVLVARGPVDAALIGRFTGENGDGVLAGDGALAGDRVLAGNGAAARIEAAARNGTRPGRPAAADLPSAADDAFALLARGAQERMLPHCRHVAVRTGGQATGTGRKPAGAGGQPG